MATSPTTMVEEAALVRLMSWLSPAFPVGAFAYSHGLERAIHDGLVGDRASLTEWLSELVRRGSGWNDAVLLAEAWRSAGAGDATAVAALAEAMASSRERHMETTLQGGAFAEAAAAWDRQRAAAAPQAALAYPVAVGLAAARHAIPLRACLAAYLHAFASNLVQAAVRLVPVGQRDGVATLAALEPAILWSAERAARSGLDDLGSCAVMSDIMAMAHETQYSRVFRT